MGESVEPRLDFIAEFTLKTLRLKPDKWSRMIISDEQRSFLMGFIETGQYHHQSFCKSVLNCFLFIQSILDNHF